MPSSSGWCSVNKIAKVVFIVLFSSAAEVLSAVASGSHSQTDFILRADRSDHATFSALDTARGRVVREKLLRRDGAPHRVESGCFGPKLISEGTYCNDLKPVSVSPGLMNLRQCEEYVILECPGSAFFNWRATNGACHCAYHECGERHNHSEVSVYTVCPRDAPAFNKELDQLTAQIFKPVASSMDSLECGSPVLFKQGSFCTDLDPVTGSPGLASKEECQRKVKLECHGSQWFNWRESNGACHCTFQDCKESVAHAGVTIYKVCNKEASAKVNANQPSSVPSQAQDVGGNPEACVGPISFRESSYCVDLRPVSGSPGISSLKACEAKVKSECPGRDWFNWRPANGACHCAFKDCPESSAHDGVGIFKVCNRDRFSRSAPLSGARGAVSSAMQSRLPVPHGNSCESIPSSEASCSSCKQYYDGKADSASVDVWCHFHPRASKCSSTSAVGSQREELQFECPLSKSNNYAKVTGEQCVRKSWEQVADWIGYADVSECKTACIADANCNHIQVGKDPFSGRLLCGFLAESDCAEPSAAPAWDHYIKVESPNAIAAAATVCTDFSVRLNEYPTGVLQICKTDAWIPVCATGFNDTDYGAHSACQDMGYRNGGVVSSARELLAQHAFISGQCLEGESLGSCSATAVDVNSIVTLDNCKTGAHSGVALTCSGTRAQKTRTVDLGAGCCALSSADQHTFREQSPGGFQGCKRRCMFDSNCKGFNYNILETSSMCVGVKPTAECETLEVSGANSHCDGAHYYEQMCVDFAGIYDSTAGGTVSISQVGCVATATSSAGTWVGERVLHVEGDELVLTTLDGSAKRTAMNNGQLTWRFDGSLVIFTKQEEGGASVARESSSAVGLDVKSDAQAHAAPIGVDKCDSGEILIEAVCVRTLKRQYSISITIGSWPSLPPGCSIKHVGGWQGYFNNATGTTNVARHRLICSGPLQTKPVSADNAAGEGKSEGEGKSKGKGKGSQSEGKGRGVGSVPPGLPAELRSVFGDGTPALGFSSCDEVTPLWAKRNEGNELFTVRRNEPEVSGVAPPIYEGEFDGARCLGQVQRVRILKSYRAGEGDCHNRTQGTGDAVCLQCSPDGSVHVGSFLWNPLLNGSAQSIDWNKSSRIVTLPSRENCGSMCVTFGQKSYRFAWHSSWNPPAEDQMTIPTFEGLCYDAISAAGSTNSTKSAEDDAVKPLTTFAFLAVLLFIGSCLGFVCFQHEMKKTLDKPAEHGNGHAN